MMEEDFRALVIAATALPASRVNFGAHPQGEALPGVVLQVISEIDGLHMQGPDRFPESRVQVDCYAPTYAAAKQVSRDVMAALHGYRGGGFGLVQHAGTRESREGGSNEADRPYRVSLDFITHWRTT